MDFPAPQVAPLHIGTWSINGPAFGLHPIATSNLPASVTWPVANTAFYAPIYLPFHYEVERVWWVNGTAVTSTNRDMGIYTASGARLFSTGSTVATGTSSVQYVSLGTPLLLSPGRYYLGISTNVTTANCGGQGVTAASVPACRFAGILQEASALPLPATMTGVAVTNSMTPYCGITSTSSGF